MNCLVTVINGFILFSTCMRITAFDFCATVNMVCVIMSCWVIDIESLSAVHDDKPSTVRKSPYQAGFEHRSLRWKAKLLDFMHYCASLFPFDYLAMLKKKNTDSSALKIAP